MAEDENEESKPIPQVTWQEHRWKEIRGWIVALFLLWFVFYPIQDWLWPDHPAPVSIEADGKNYVACNTPEIGRGYFHSTYYADFKDNNGSMVSLRGIDKMIVTNLPKTVDAPMPVFRLLPTPLPDVNGTDKDGKPYQEGFIYTWTDGSAAMFKNHQWVSVPGLPTITPGMEGKLVALDEDEFRVSMGGKAQVKNGKWMPVKVKNKVCDPDEQR
jgi:hypothetical protein